MLRIFKQYYPIRNIFFVIGEGLFIFFSVWMASFIVRPSDTLSSEYLLIGKVLLVTIVCQSCIYYADLYEFNLISSGKEIVIKLFQAIGFSAILLSFIYFLFPDAVIGSGVFLASICILSVLIGSWRLTYATILKRGIFDEKIIIIGSNELAQNIVNEINHKGDSGYRIACVVIEKYHEGTIKDAKSPIIRKLRYKKLSELAIKLKVKKIVVGIKERRGELPTHELLKCKVSGIDVLEGNSFYEMLTGKLSVEQINPSWLIFSDGFKKSYTKRFFKRLADIILSTILCIIFSPFLLVVAVLIKIDSAGPVFFSQERIGQGRKPYYVHKFRSMVQDAEKLSGPVWAQDHDARVTRVGKIIRKLRIDEVPQIWNVLKGEMSFVGPRPERKYFVDQLEKEIPYYGERFSVKPGISGWAQVSYGYGATVEDAIEKLKYDLFYIKNLSIFMDIMIVLKTIKIVIFGRGAR
jgi:sugar transferase (PEP-CTERM system associated)